MIRYLFSGSIPTFIEISICLIMAYVCAYGYDGLIKLIKNKIRQYIP